MARLTAYDSKFRVESNGCWTWIGAKRGKRGTTYGAIRLGCMTEYAHRAFYEWYKGPIPDGFIVHHKCFNTLCVNPDHLEVMSDRSHRKTYRWHGPRPKISPEG